MKVHPVLAQPLEGGEGREASVDRDPWRLVPGNRPLEQKNAFLARGQLQRCKNAIHLPGVAKIEGSLDFAGCGALPDDRLVRALPGEPPIEKDGAPAHPCDRLHHIEPRVRRPDENEVLCRAEVVKDTDDLDVDSLSMVEVVVAAEEKFGVRIPDDDVKNLKTVGDAVTYIEKAGVTA